MIISVYILWTTEGVHIYFSITTNRCEIFSHHHCISSHLYWIQSPSLHFIFIWFSHHHCIYLDDNSCIYIMNNLKSGYIFVTTNRCEIYHICVHWHKHHVIARPINPILYFKLSYFPLTQLIFISGNFHPFWSVG